MNRNCSPYDYRATIVLVAFMLFAFMLLAALLMPDGISLSLTLPVLIELLRLALKAPNDG
jgi:hypothetical protein